ncbi:MAG: threonine-phosphate decarboxylase [Moorea sp. SIO4E2]|uniref:threonine-phosphate decarboxylase CobD n=1 Tax=Moorena sp. SIO4E2 TaxID=2607826 RepID=UPI0013BBAF4E|nr:threonine-phosphate decarboxylase CobD [Moorena sp. SIO4E2]NEQ07322.1 threonine-phosphate decarboxylase [Moorena sp. SIO4E2]
MKRPTHGGNLAWAAALANCPPSLILDFSASINPLGPPKSAIAAIESGLNNLVAYPDPNYAELRQCLTQLHPTLPPDWIIPGNGSAELLTWACRELSELDETLIITPAFRDYQRGLKAFGARIRKCPLMRELSRPSLRWGDGEMGREIHSFIPLLPDSLTSLLPQEGTRKGLLLNTPHNPTGQLFSSKAIQPYLKQFALVVVDEAFMDFLPPEQEQSLIPLIGDYPNLVILRSLTKFYSLPGLRLGYGIAHPERLQRWQKWRDPWPINTLAAAAAAAVVQDRAFQQQTWDWLAPARRQLFQGLAKLPGLQPYPSAANFLLVHSEKSTSQIQAQLLQHHRILIRDCLSFPELGDRFFRVAVRTQADNQRLLTALDAILIS